MKTTLKIVIPMAGLGTRLRPHTWSKPKQLVSVAGKTVLDYVLDTLATLPDSDELVLINIVGYLSEQIEAHLTQHYPDLKAYYIIQENPRGQSQAIQLASEYLTGPMLVVFADTLINPDLSFLANEQADAVVWVQPVEDPSRFGVAEVDEDGWVTRLTEKPQGPSSNLAVVGFYYFRDAEQVLSAIDEQMRRDLQLKGEYYLVDAVNIMLERGLKMRTQAVDIWLDAGTPEALLATNRYLLENGHSNNPAVTDGEDVVIEPPVFIHPSAHLTNAIIGPYVSLGAGCRVKNSILRDSILEDEAEVSNVILRDSLIGRCAQISGSVGSVNAGDHSTVRI
jgi:glucose-1-phosphate thymidylyltransferase